MTGVFTIGKYSQYTSISRKSHVFALPYDWQIGHHYAALIVPTLMRFNYDALLLRWNVWTYNETLWITEPIPIIFPYYEEIGEYEENYWSVDFYNSTGHWVAGTWSCVRDFYGTIKALVSKVLAGAKTYQHSLVNSKPYAYIPDTLTVLDTSVVNNTQYSQGVSALSSVIFGALSLMDNVLLSYWLNIIAGTTGGIAGAVIGGPISL